jgi:hypothetical protein
MRFVFSLLLLLAQPAFGQETRIVGPRTFPPYVTTQGGNLSGFDVELMSDVSRRNGFARNYNSLSLDRALVRVAQLHTGGTIRTLHQR